MRPRSCLSKIFWSLVRGLDGGCEEVEQRRLRGAGTPSGRRSALTPPLRPLTPLSTPLILYRLHHSLYTFHILLTPLHKYTLDTLRPLYPLTPSQQLVAQLYDLFHCHLDFFQPDLIEIQCSNALQCTTYTPLQTPPISLSTVRIPQRASICQTICNCCIS